LREALRLRDFEGGLDAVHGEREITVEELKASKLCSQPGKRLVRRFRDEHVKGTVHALERLSQSPFVPHDFTEPSGHSGCRMCRTVVLEQGDRPLKVIDGLICTCTRLRHEPGLLEHLRLFECVAGQLRCTPEVSLCLEVCSE